MVKCMRIGSLFLLMVCCGAVSLRAQVASESHLSVEAAKAHAVEGSETGGDSDYVVRRGTNEFGVWGGGAFNATTVFGGLKSDETQGRKFVVAAFRYGRTLAANDSMALQYTLDVIPLAVATRNISQQATVVTPSGPTTTFRRESTYGGGLTPFGLQLDFRNSSRVKPFIHVNAGGLIFTKSVPLPDAGRFAFTLEGGTGVRIFSSFKRAVSLGVRLHHISNGNRSGSNRGLNQIVFQMGFSVFK